jgi:hypothetical protein
MAGIVDATFTAKTSSAQISTTLHFIIGPRIHQFSTFLDFFQRNNYYGSSSAVFYTPLNNLRVDRDGYNRLIVSAEGGLVRIEFQSAGYHPLQPGVYSGAVNNAHTTDQTALDVYNGNQCDRGTGSFTVKEITYGPLNTVLSFWATYELHCAAGMLIQNSGEIRYHVDADDPLLIPEVTVPAAVEVNQGDTVSFQAGANRGATGFSQSGLPRGLLFDPTSGTVSGSPSVGGTYRARIYATNSVGTGEGDVVFSVKPKPLPAHSLLNVSTRSHVGTGDDVMIGGFIIRGSAAKPVVIRALGPSLALGPSRVANAAPDPTLKLSFPSGVLQYRDNLMDSPYSISAYTTSDLDSVGLTPSDYLEPAALLNLPPGAYTAIVAGAKNTTGISLVEAYDINPESSSLANISTRARVGSGDDVMIAGFIIGGDQSTKVLIRAIGPSLANSGLKDSLDDPTVELHDGNGTSIAQNDDWRSNQETQIQGTGIPPTDERESAIFGILQPGAYTAIVRAKADNGGVALVEVYNLDSP